MLGLTADESRISDHVPEMPQGQKSGAVRGPSADPAVRDAAAWDWTDVFLLPVKSFNMFPATVFFFFPLLFPESFAASNRELCDEEKEFVHFPVCEGTSQPEPSCSAVRITANKNYRSKTTQEGALKKMHEEEHHQQMSILQLQLIQMNEVHVAKIQQIERECEMAEEEHRIKMEVLNKKKMYWERKLQTFTKEWPVSSFNRPFPNSP